MSGADIAATGATDFADTDKATEREADRQRWLLQTLWQRGPAADAADWLVPLRRPGQGAASAESGPSLQDGVLAYRSNAYAAAGATLAATFPTVAALVGDESIKLLARAYRQAEPPARGDLAWFGARLPDFIAASTDLAELPWLADVARLDWALAQADAAPDAEPDRASLALLAEVDPAELSLRLAPGSVLIDSRWPVVMIWQAHQPPGQCPAEAPHDTDAIWTPVRAALAAGRRETALVWREGWRARVAAPAPAEAALLGALLAGASLGDALQAAGPELDFGAWLVSALQTGLLLGAQHRPAAS
jgi:hypothetical protein